MDGMRWRNRHGRVLLTQRTRHPVRGHKLAVIDISIRGLPMVRSDQDCGLTGASRGRGRPDQYGRRCFEKYFVCAVSGWLSKSSLWGWAVEGPCLVDSSWRATVWASRPWTFDRTRIPVVDDGKTGANLFVAAGTGSEMLKYSSHRCENLLFRPATGLWRMWVRGMFDWE